ncbi:MAG: YlxR family protein [Dehalococcoidia bacterium]|nr:YlxR family protein [Dehalococcoidia bacterium]
MSDTKHDVPERTCVACHQTKPKHELVRLVHTPAGNIEIDLRGKKAGRGAYLCKRRECWDMALAKGRKDRLAHSFKTEVAPEDRSALSDYGKTLPVTLTTGERGVG